MMNLLDVKPAGTHTGEGGGNLGDTSYTSASIIVLQTFEQF